MLVVGAASTGLCAGAGAGARQGIECLSALAWASRTLSSAPELVQTTRATPYASFWGLVWAIPAMCGCRFTLTALTTQGPRLEVPDQMKLSCDELMAERRAEERVLQHVLRSRCPSFFVCGREAAGGPAGALKGDSRLAEVGDAWQPVQLDAVVAANPLRRALQERTKAQGAHLLEFLHQLGLRPASMLRTWASAW